MLPSHTTGSRKYHGSTTVPYYVVLSSNKELGMESKSKSPQEKFPHEFTSYIYMGFVGNRPVNNYPVMIRPVCQCLVGSFLMRNLLRANVRIPKFMKLKNTVHSRLPISAPCSLPPKAGIGC